MDVLFLATSNYEDPFSEDWHADLRYTVSYLRRHDLKVGIFGSSRLGG